MEKASLNWLQTILFLPIPFSQLGLCLIIKVQSNMLHGWNFFSFVTSYTGEEQLIQTNIKGFGPWANRDKRFFKLKLGEKAKTEKIPHYIFVVSKTLNYQSPSHFKHWQKRQSLSVVKTF